MNTPLPYSFATNRGVESKIKNSPYLKPTMHKASLLVDQLPKYTVCISQSRSEINYRMQHDRWHYALVTAAKKINPHTGKQYVWISGSCENYELHKQFMETINLLHPHMMQLFSR